MIEDKIITQLSIFVNNEPGRLATISRIIKETGIKVRAFNLAESAEFGILRAIVVDPDSSYDRLKQNGIIVRKTDIIAISVQDAPIRSSWPPMFSGRPTSTSSTATSTPVLPAAPSSSASTTPPRPSTYWRRRASGFSTTGRSEWET